MRRGLILLWVVLVSLSGRSLAQEPDRAIPAFNRQKLELSSTRCQATGNATLRLAGKQAVYPAGTSLLLQVRYLQSMSSAKHPFGDPALTSKDGSRKIVITKRVTVGAGWAFEAALSPKRYLPPGEYVVVSSFALIGQKRKVRREFIAKYIPLREAHDPCAQCRYHYGITKVAVADPRFKLRARFAAMEGALWQKQRADYRDRVVARYRTWSAALDSAHGELLALSQTVLGCDARTIEILQRPPVAGVAGAAHALKRLRVLSGLVSSRAALLALAQAPRLPATPQGRWELALGRKRAPIKQRAELLRLLRPARFCARRPAPPKPSIAEQVADVLAGMQAYRGDVAVLIDPSRFHALQEAAQGLARLLATYDAMATSAMRATSEQLVDQLDGAGGADRVTLERRIQARWELVLRPKLLRCHTEGAQVAARLEACRRARNKEAGDR